MESDRGDIKRAALLGIIQGPTEVLPVSSSAHLAMFPRLMGWDWEAIDPETRKSFEVALHAGAAAALLVARRREILEELGRFDLDHARVLVLSFAPAAIVGYTLERKIEARLGGPRTTVAGLIAGAVLMALADLRPQDRGRGDVHDLDGLALGIGQAAALVPGVSRNGATLTAARARRFTRKHSSLLSRTVALPVILGAVALKGARLAKRGTTPEQNRWLAVGVVTSFVSTLASNRLIDLVEKDGALPVLAAYRIAFAALIWSRLSSGAASGVESVSDERL